jgi:hypothetical protein
VRTKIRNAYGVEPKEKEFARQEDGVLVCAPQAHGALSSGGDEKFWVKRPGNRIDANRPEHVRTTKSFFLRRGMGEQTFSAAGDVVLIASDHVFPDNHGFYELHLILKRGSGKVPAPTPSSRLPAPSTSGADAAQPGGGSPGIRAAIRRWYGRLRRAGRVAVAFSVVGVIAGALIAIGA